VHELAAALVGRREVAEDMWVLSFVAGPIGAEARPGQFVNLGLPAGPLLRRPFSVYRVEGEVVEVVLKAVGVGTRMLLDLLPGQAVSCLGPLGRPFALSAEAGPVALVSGGLGVAPMIMAAREAKRLGLPVTWFHGARSAQHLSREWEGDQVVWATDDGSRGLTGSILNAVPDGLGQVLACGPNPMLKAVAAKWPLAQVALETYMGCGTGVCLGCAVPLVAGGFDRACTEGPIYRAADVDWDRLPGHLSYAE
jgi:dihydroorotate dehydrogenase electron transfer subunit